LNPAASRILHDYQRVAYTWGPLLAACLLAVLAALVLRRGVWRQRLDAALLAAITLLALTVSQALSVFSYRYVMIASFGLPAAAALAVAALGSRSRGRPV
jgi:type II secretory pathway component PulF